MCRILDSFRVLHLIILFLPMGWCHGKLCMDSGKYARASALINLETLSRLLSVLMESFLGA